MLGVGFQQIQHISYIIFFSSPFQCLVKAGNSIDFTKNSYLWKKGTHLIILPHLQMLEQMKNDCEIQNEMHAIFDHMPNLKIQFAAFDKIKMAYCYQLWRICFILNFEDFVSLWNVWQ